MKTIDDLQQFYQQEIVPGLSQLEVLRKAQLRRVRFMWIATVVSLFVGFISMMPPLILVCLLISLLLYFLIKFSYFFWFFSSFKNQNLKSKK